MVRVRVRGSKRSEVVVVSRWRIDKGGVVGRKKLQLELRERKVQ
jgi:hypothetical protein